MFDEILHLTWVNYIYSGCYQKPQPKMVKILSFFLMLDKRKKKTWEFGPKSNTLQIMSLVGMYWSWNSGPILILMFKIKFWSKAFLAYSLRRIFILFFTFEEFFHFFLTYIQPKKNDISLVIPLALALSTGNHFSFCFQMLSID